MSDIITNTHGIRLPSRYLIRRLDMSVLEWVTAMGIDGFMLRNPSLWNPLLPYPKMANALAGLDKLSSYYAQAISSGFSYGIFDTEYAFKNPLSFSSPQMLHWRTLDPGHISFETYGAAQMQDAMDFPLVCIALSVDAFAPGDPYALFQLLDMMPLHGQLSSFLASLPLSISSSPSSSSSSKSAGKQHHHHVLDHQSPTDYNQILIRTGCVTRKEYQGQGLATALNRFVMHEAKAWGFSALRVRLSSASLLRRSYARPPQGVRSEIVAHWDFEAIEMQCEDEYGELVVRRPYKRSGLKEGWEVWCDLRR
ncbi:hypothetical protein F5Y17DRAFT_478175 [Xylariaceae sp. FL0594]|nr:hypothetical protein F5Y17DRAFT_478175 [Xylariaceae sp. FL0594]